MHPILEISSSQSFEKVQPPKTQEKEVETSPFLKLVREENTKVAEDSSIEHVEEEGSQLEKVEEDALEENLDFTLEPDLLDEEIDTEQISVFLIPQNWEVSEELLQEEEESLETELEISLKTEETKTQEKTIDSIKLQDLREEFYPKLDQDLETSSDEKENLAFFETISFQEKKENFINLENQEKETKNDFSTNFGFSKNELEILNSQSLETLFTLKEKIEKYSQKPKPYTEIQAPKQEVLELKETKTSGDMLLLLKNKTSLKQEEQTEVKAQETKQNSLSPNVKIQPKEELTFQTKQTQVQEKEASNIQWSVQQIKSPTQNKETSKPNFVQENKKSTSELFQKNTLEFVKTAKFQILENGKNSAYIELEPKELGKVLLQITMEKDKVQGKLFFETESAKLIFQSELQNLKNELRIAGLELESLTIDLNHSEQNTRDHYGFENSGELASLKQSNSQVSEEDSSSLESLPSSTRLLDVRV